MCRGIFSFDRFFGCCQCEWCGILRILLRRGRILRAKIAENWFWEDAEAIWGFLLGKSIKYFWREHKRGKRTLQREIGSCRKPSVGRFLLEKFIFATDGGFFTIKIDKMPKKSQKGRQKRFKGESRAVESFWWRFYARKIDFWLSWGFSIGKIKQTPLRELEDKEYFKVLA